MYKRKGLYTTVYVHNISKEELEGEISDWLKGRWEYMQSLWKEVSTAK